MTARIPIPRDRAWDATTALLRHGYAFIGNRCRPYGTDVFETRLLLRRVVCAQGSEAARLLYEPDRFARRGAVLPTTLKLLQDVGSVQTLDGAAHRARKALFLSMLDSEGVARMLAAAESAWRVIWSAGTAVRVSG